MGNDHVNTGPLAGIKVVDMSVMIAGPLAAMMLADQGADVVKVESPGMGDMMRHLGSSKNGMTGIYVNNNRGKRSLVIDVKKQAGLDVMRRLIADADILIQNFRPGAMDRMGLGWEAIHELNPQLIYTSISGYGSDGPSSGRRAYDNVIQAASGLASVQAHPATGTPELFRTLVCDKATAHTATQAITAALYRRAMTGEGDSIEVPMAEVMASFNLIEHLGGLTFEPPIGPFSYARVTTPNRRPRRTRDGWVVILPYSTQNWRDFFEFVSRSELIDDARFADQRSRVANSDTLYGMLDDLVADFTTSELLDLCDARSIPAAAVMSLEDIADDPHFAAVDLLHDDTHPTEGPYRVTRDPIRFDSRGDEQGLPHRHAPRLGEHTAEVLAEVGWKPEDLAALNTT